MDEKALLIRIGGIGDTILASSVVGLLKEHYPDMEIDFLASPGLRELLTLVPGIRRVYALPWQRLPLRIHPPWMALRRSLNQDYYRLAYLMETDPRFLPLLQGLNAEQRIAIGEVEKKTGNGFDLPVARRYQKVLYYCKLVPQEISYPRLVPGPQEEELVDRLLDSFLSDEGGLNMIGIHAGNSFPIRKRWRSMFRNQDIRSWPEDRWSDLICRMHRFGKDLSFVLFGGAPDLAVNRRIEANIRDLDETIPVFNVAGKLDLPAAAALLKRFSLFVSTDTGPLHMAAAVGTPLIGLYGPTRYLQTGPFCAEATAIVMRGSLPCQPCYGTPLQKTCKSNLCMQSISVQDVLNKIVETRPDLFP